MPNTPAPSPRPPVAAEVERVKALREAFVNGAVWADGGSTAPRLFDINAVSESTARYPMPAVTVPRVVELGDMQYRFVNDALELKDAAGCWIRSGRTIEHILTLADLIANPTTTLPADEVRDE